MDHKHLVWLADIDTHIRYTAHQTGWNVKHHRKSRTSESIYVCLARAKETIRIRISCHGGAPIHLTRHNISIVHPKRAGMYDKTLEHLHEMLLTPPS